MKSSGPEIAGYYRKASCLSKVSFCWSLRYLREALQKKDLEFSQMLDLYPSQRSQRLGQKLQRSWQDERIKRRKQASLTRALWHVFQGKFLLVAFLAFIAESLVGVGFYLMALIIDRLVEGVQNELSWALVWGFSFSLVFLVFVRHNYQQLNSVTFLQIRQTLTALIYQKALNLGLRSVKRSLFLIIVLLTFLRIGQGKILSLASSQLVVLDHGHIFMIHLLFEPFVSAVHLALMGMLIGLNIVWGFLLMVGVILLQLLFAKCLKTVRNKSGALSSKRSEMIQNILAGIRTIKCQCWEQELAKQVANVRKREAKSHILINVIKTSAFTILRFSGYVAAAIVFYIQSLKGEQLDPGSSFSTLATLNFLSFYVCLFMGYGITTMAEFLHIIDQIQQILTEEEKTPDMRGLDRYSNRVQEIPTYNDPIFQIVFTDVTVTWGEKSKTAPADSQNEMPCLGLVPQVSHAGNQLELPEQVSRRDINSISRLESSERQFKHTFSTRPSNSNIHLLSRHSSQTVLKKLPKVSYEEVLSNLDIKIRKGELIAVIGPVSAGKSSLLSTILGETYLLGQGYIGLPPKAKISYVPQTPFLFSDTIKNNVLFGLRYQADRFRMVCDASGLEDDLRIMPDGHQTYITDNGSNLSGGQRARISLARALYASSDIYLLDDPLSAVDAIVQKTLMHKAILTFLANKTRILVTHQLHILPLVDRILYLEEGEVKFFGTYEEIRNAELNLEDAMTLAVDQINPVLDQNFDPHSLDLMVIDTNNDISPYATPMSTNSRRRSKEPENFSNAIRKADFKRKSSRMSQFCKLKAPIVPEIQSLSRPQDGSPEGLKCHQLFQFLRYSCHFCTLIFLIIASLVPALLNLLISQCLRRWVDSQEDEALLYRNIFLAIVIGFLATNLFRNIMVSIFTAIQSRNLHRHMLDKVIGSKIQFFDQNPLGGILQRFTKDIGVIDSAVPVISTWFSQFFFRVITVFVLISFVIPWLTIIVVGVFIFAMIIRSKFLQIMRKATKLEALSKSPITSIIGSTLQGLPTIRTYRKRRYFMSKFELSLDQNTRAFLTLTVLSRSFCFFLDLICAILIISTLALSFAVNGKVQALQLAMIIQLVNDLMGTFQTAIRLSLDIDNYMNSLNRCLEYTELPQEDVYKEDCKEDDIEYEQSRRRALNLPRRSWIREGRITFFDAALRYRSDLPLALKHLTFDITPGMKVGIVGRTGAGKSSILLALFRLFELNGGRIEIDGADISKLSLHTLRKNISIIPQTPFLFPGTVRYNLDPFKERGEASDELMWNVLDKVALLEKLASFESGLDTKIGESNGIQLSSGEKQLLCIARAILERNRIVVMDEATANIDVQTDDVIQKTIREQFKGVTVIMIAHRLNTIIDADLVVVMDKGRIEEQDHPLKLLTHDVEDPCITNDSKFADLVMEQSNANSSFLFERARASFYSKSDIDI